MLLTDYPWYFILFCLLAGVAYAAVLYFVGHNAFSRGWRWALAALRCLAVSAIAFLLLAPMTRQKVDERQKPHVVLAQDVSQSVRLSADSAFSLRTLVPELEDHCRVSYEEFGSEASTDIGAVLDRWKGDDVAALVLASDGLHNRGVNPTSMVERMPFAVHCVALGDTTARRDARLENLRCNRIASLGADIAVEMTANATLLRGKRTRLVVNDGGGRQLVSQPVDYTDDNFSTTLTASLPTDKAGLQRFTATLVPVEGEATDANNSLAFYVDVIDSRHKVAIFAHAPHPDLAALKRAIESNPNYEAEVVSASDAESGKWKGEAHLAILHNLPSRLHPSVAYAEAMPQIYVVGLQTDLTRFNALHNGLEIIAKAQRTNEVTALHRPTFSLFTLGDDDVSMLESMPPLTAPFGEARLAPSVQTLFAAKVGNIDSRQPLVAATSQGGVRRAWIWGEGLWHWRLAEWQSHERQPHVDRLITQLVSFTAQTAGRNRLQVEAARSYSHDEPVTLRAVLYNENYEAVNSAEVRLELIGEATKAEYTFRRDAGGYSLTLPPLSEGLYRYVARADGQTAEGTFAVEEMNLEQQRLSADHTLLTTLATLTGGEVYAVDQCAALKSQLLALKPTIYSHTRYAEFLRLPWVLLLILLLLAAEWGLRKYQGKI